MLLNVLNYTHQCDETKSNMYDLVKVVKLIPPPLFFIRIPKDWTYVGRVDPKEELQLTFALKQQNVDLLEKMLRVVSDPDSAGYGGTHSYLG